MWLAVVCPLRFPFVHHYGAEPDSYHRVCDIELGNPISECLCQHCAVSIGMVRDHNWRLGKVQIQKQLFAGNVLAENIECSIEWASEPTHLSAALVRCNNLLHIGENAAR